MTFRELGKDETVGPGEHWVTVTQGMSGYFAVQMWMNNEDSTMVFAEPYDTGFGRYATYDEAKGEAMFMAEEMDLPYYFERVQS